MSRIAVNVGKFQSVTATKETSHNIAHPNIETEVNNMQMDPLVGLNSLNSYGPSQAHDKSSKSPIVVQQAEQQMEQAH